MVEILKYVKLILLVFILFSKIGASQTNTDTIKEKKIILKHSSIRDLNSFYSKEDSSTYIFAQISHTLNEVGSTFEINGKVYTSNKHKEEIWIAKVDKNGDTLFTKIISDIPEYRSIYSAIVEKGSFYFVLSNTYILNSRELRGCLFVNYDLKTNKVTSTQIHEIPYKLGDCLIKKDNNNFYLIVEDKPHHCLPPEWNVYLLQLSKKGKIIQKRVFDKTICKGGAFDPKLIFVNQSKMKFYMSDAVFYKKNQKIDNSCKLDLIDAFEGKSIPYVSYKKYISEFSLNSLKTVKKTYLPCDIEIKGFLNDTDYVCVKNDSLGSGQIRMVFKSLKNADSYELEIQKPQDMVIKILSNEIHTYSVSGDYLIIEKIRNKQIVFSNRYFVPNVIVNSIVPIQSKDKTRFFYNIETLDKKNQIYYFDE